MISSLDFYAPDISILLGEPSWGHKTSQNDHIRLSKDCIKQCQNWLVLQSQKLVQVVLHNQQQLLILWSDILTMKCTPANFIGHLWAKSSIEITFHHSQKDICPIWVGFFKQSMGILWLLYQVLHVIKWFLGLNNWNGPAIPSRFGFVQKTSICKQPCLKST